MIFNTKLIQLHHEFARAHSGDSGFLIEHAANEIMHDLDLLNINPSNILEISPRAGHLSRKIEKRYPDKTFHSTTDPEFDNFQTNFDLIVSCMNFHWINEVEKHLRHINSILTDEGKYILNFAASGSLENLKHFLIQCELKASIGHSPHIIPFPKEDKVQTMFQQCGFKFVVVSTEKIELEYKNPVKLMKDLKNMGENNALSTRIGALPKTALSSDSSLHDIINLVTVVAGRNA